MPLTEVRQPTIYVKDCPADIAHCVIGGGGTCVHFRGVMVLQSGYIGVVCTAALEEESDSGDDALQQPPRDGECDELPIGD